MEGAACDGVDTAIEHASAEQTESEECDQNHIETPFSRIPKHIKKEMRKRKVIELRHQKYDRYNERKKQKRQQELAEENAAIACGDLPPRPFVPGPSKKEILCKKMEEAMAHGQNICIDLAYDVTNHNERERSSLVKQLILCYSYLKTSPASVHMHLASIDNGSPLYDRLHNMGHENWFASRHTRSSWEVFDTSKIVFLSPDATDVITDIDPDLTYVIGGIIDRTVKKAITLGEAERLGARAMRLPLQEHTPGLSTHILNVDHVFRILLDYIQFKVCQL